MKDSFDIKFLEIMGLPIQITKRRMKNMYIRIDKDDASVKVSMPQRVSYKEAETFVKAHYDWIVKERERVLCRRKLPPKQYISGETVYLWGQAFELEFVPSYCDKGAYVSGDKIILMAPLDSDSQQRKAVLNAMFRGELAEEIELIWDRCQKITGTDPKEWRIRDMKTKWGTCNIREKRIWLSLMLVNKPKIYLEYVIIHEMTHLYVPDHGPRFKEYMDSFFPDWRRVRKMMNES